MENDKKNKLRQDLSLALMHLCAWEEKDITRSVIYRCWKGYDFAVMDHLKKNDLIDFNYKAKSLYITDKGIREAERILAKFIPAGYSDSF